MASLSALRNKFKKLEEQKKAEEELTGNTNRFSSSDDTGNNTGFTAEITDHTSWMGKIADQGNRPEEWLDYVEFCRKNVKFEDKDRRYTYLRGVFERALKAIPEDTARRKEAYAKFLIIYAQLKSENDDMHEAQTMYNNARIVCKRFAIVHIAAAQFFLDQGNRSKSKKALERACDVQAEPAELLNIAYKNLLASKTQLLSDEEKENSAASANKCPESGPKPILLAPRKSWIKSDVLQDVKEAPPADENKVISKPPPGCVPQRLRAARMNMPATPVAQGPDKKGPTLPPSSSSVSSSSVVQPPSFDSAVSFKGEHKERLRAACMNMPATPVAQGPNKKGPTLPPSSSSVVQPPSFDTTVSFRGEQRERKLSGNSDADTVPLSLDLNRGIYAKSGDTDFKLPLRSSHSTPDCKAASLISSSGTRRRPFLAVGKPQRVKRLPIPVEIKEDSSDEDENKDYDFKPLETTQPAVESDDERKSQQAVELMMKDDSPRTDSGIVTQPIEYIQEMDTSDDVPMEVDNNGQSAMPQNEGCKPCSPEFAPENIPVVSAGGSNKPHYASVPQHNAPAVPQAQPAVGLPVPNMPLPQSQQPVQGMPFGTLHTPSHQGAGSVLGMQNLSMNQQQQQQYYQAMAAMHQQQQLNVPIPHMHNFSTPMMKNANPIITINGKTYTILKILGRGGTSKVFEVLDADNNLRAVKQVNLDGADDCTLEGYKNEITLLKRLQPYSQFIVKMYDFEYNMHENMLYVVLERGDIDLATLFRNRTKHGEGITDEMRKFYWTEMLRAVHVLQKEGIVHSDLKPANFLLVAGKLKLIDFGIANAIQQDKTSVVRENQVGTLNYMSPEAIMDTCGGAQVDANGRVKPRIKLGVKSDVWSLGCILYNMVYKTTPFQRINNQIGKLQAIINPNFAIEFPDIEDKALLDTLKACLIRDPAKRPGIEDLLKHPYITNEKAEEQESAANSLTKESLQKLMLQLSQANVSSPGSISAVSEGLLRQLKSGKEMDLASVLSGRHQSKTAHMGSGEHNGKQQSVKHIPRAPLQRLNFGELDQ